MLLSEFSFSLRENKGLFEKNPRGPATRHIVAPSYCLNDHIWHY